MDTDLRVTHRGRRIVVNAAEISVTLDQRCAHHEVLRHPDESVVNGGVPCRAAGSDTASRVCYAKEDVIKVHGRRRQHDNCLRPRKKHNSKGGRWR